MGLSQKWLTNMAYIYTIQDGWTDLASVMDFGSVKSLAMFIQQL